MSATAAARFARYAGEPRTAGYAAIRTRAVTTLLAMAEQDGWECPSRIVSEGDKDKLLNALMRSQDPQVRLRAIEASDKRREREIERARNEEPERDPYDTLREIEELSPLLAQQLARKHDLDFQLSAEAAKAALVELEKEREFLMRIAADTACGDSRSR